MRAIFFFFEGEWKTGMGKQTFFYEVADEIITKQGADEALILVCTQMYKTWTMHWIWRASQKQRRTSCPLNTPQSCCTHLACSVSFRDAVPTRQKGTQPFRVSSVELHGIHFHVVLPEKKQKLYPNPPLSRSVVVLISNILKLTSPNEGQDGEDVIRHPYQGLLKKI